MTHLSLNPEREKRRHNNQTFVQSGRVNIFFTNIEIVSKEWMLK